MKQTLHFIGLALLLACWAPRTQAQWTFSNGYNVLDAANDNTSGITGVTSTNYGNTTGQERAIAYRLLSARILPSFISQEVEPRQGTAERVV